MLNGVGMGRERIKGGDMKGGVCIFYIQTFHTFLIFFSFISYALCLEKAVEYPLTFKTSPAWQEFSLKPYERSFKFEKWVCQSLITFKSKKALKLQALTLQWGGKKLNHLSASLYVKKYSNSLLLPIEENLVSDGVWNRTQQQIVFKLNEKIVAVNDYYLVLSFPRTLESFVKRGTFSVAKTDLLAWSP